MHRGGRLREVDTASVFEDFWGGAQRNRLVLWLRGECNAARVAVENQVHGAEDNAGAKVHQAVVHRADILVLANGNALLQDDVARVYLVLEHEGGYTCLAVAVDNCPVDRRGAAVLRQERSMEVEGT